jgi:hypothetical protein
MWRITENNIEPTTEDGKPTELAHSDDYIEGTTLPAKFRILDADGNVYFHGEMSNDQFDGLPEQQYAPLWDYAEPLFGATDIEFWANEGWHHL